MEETIYIRLHVKLNKHGSDILNLLVRCAGRDSSVGIATRYGLDGPWIESRCGGGARFSAPVQTGPGAHPASCTMGTGSFLGVKRQGRGVEHPPTSSAEVEGRVELYICSPSGPSWPVVGRNLPLPLTCNQSTQRDIPQDLNYLLTYPL